MKIVGIGTEIVECVRIGRMIQEHGELFLARVFTPRELRQCQKGKNATERIAAQWAAKEAIFKAIGIKAVKKLRWTEIEIRQEKKGNPSVHLRGAIKDHAQDRQIAEIQVTLAHCRAYATACAIALKT